MGNRYIFYNPIVEKDDGVYLKTTMGAMGPLRYQGGAPVKPLLEGWCASFSYAAFWPIVLVEVRHEYGALSTFFVDGLEATWLCDTAEALPPAACDVIRNARARWSIAGDEEREAIAGFALFNDETQYRTERRFPLPQERARVDLVHSAQLFTAGAQHASVVAHIDCSMLTRPDNLRGGWVRREWAAVGERWSTEGLFSEIVLGPIPRSSSHYLQFEIDSIAFPHTLCVKLNGAVIGQATMDPKWAGPGLVVSWPVSPLSLDPHLNQVSIELIPVIRNTPVALGFYSVTLLSGPTVEDDPALEPSALLKCFQGLGDNCEFGFVQRHYGIEPLGLFRFGGFPGDTFNDLGVPRQLIRMLDAGFEGLGDPGSVAIPCWDNEYWVHDTIYGLRYHSFRYGGVHDPVEVLKEAQISLEFLKRKILEDLADTETIWVYKRVVNQDLAEIIPLWHALNRHGPCRLFWVTEAHDGLEPGEVRWVAPNLLKGCSNTIICNQGNHCDPVAWLKLCQSAYAMFKLQGSSNLGSIR